MRNILIIALVAIGISCSKTNDPVPVKYTSVLGTWQLENGGFVITFDVILVKNPSSPYDPKTDSIFTANGTVTYMGKTTKSTAGISQKVLYDNGFYTFSIWTNVGKCPACAANGTQLASYFPNSTFTEMTGRERDPNSINWDGTWVSIMYYDGTPNNTVPIFLKEPLILKRIKGPY
jgi:hypothetical protein